MFHRHGENCVHVHFDDNVNALVDFLLSEALASSDTRITLGFSKGSTMANIPLNTGDQAVGTITATDANGNPVTLDAGSVSASVSDTSTLSATVSADGTTVTVATRGPLTTPGTPNTLTVTGTVNGVKVTTPGVQLFDVVAGVGGPSTITLTFAGEVPNAPGAVVYPVGTGATPVAPVVGSALPGGEVVAASSQPVTLADGTIVYPKA